MSTDRRTAIIREICKAEGHGRTTDAVHSLTLFTKRRWCQRVCVRGCGTLIVDLLDTHSFAELQAILDQLGVDSSAEFDRGRINIWPAEESP